MPATRAGSTSLLRRKRSSARQAPASPAGRSGVRSTCSFGKRSSITCAKPMRRSISADSRVACDASSSVSRGAGRRPCAPSSSPAVRPAARLSAPTWVSRIEPATSENSVTTCTPVRTSSLIASLTGGRSGAITRDRRRSRRAAPARRRTRAASAAVDAVGDLGDVLVAEFAGRLGDLPVDQLEERRRVGRQHEGEAEVLARARAGRAAAARRARPPPAAPAAPSRR